MVQKLEHTGSDRTIIAHAALTDGNGTNPATSPLLVHLLALQFERITCGRKDISGFCALGFHDAHFEGRLVARHEYGHGDLDSAHFVYVFVMLKANLEING